MEKTFGFIFTRHVNSAKTNEYWKECIRSIRKHYPVTTPILIIDDNSNREYLVNADIPNVQVIQSEFIERGELLAYYYFYKLRPFDKACIIHDSVFVQKYIDFSKMNEDVNLLWGFFPHICEDSKHTPDLINKLTDSDTLMRIYEDTSKWVGLFGCMSVITLPFLDILADKYNLFILLEHVKSRPDRICLERILGILFVTEIPESKNNLLLGDIARFPYNFRFRYEHYLKWLEIKYPVKTLSFRPNCSVNTEFDDHPFIKVWSGR